MSFRGWLARKIAPKKERHEFTEENRNKSSISRLQKSIAEEEKAALRDRLERLRERRERQRIEQTIMDLEDDLADEEEDEDDSKEEGGWIEEIGKLVQLKRQQEQMALPPTAPASTIEWDDVQIRETISRLKKQYGKQKFSAFSLMPDNLKYLKIKEHFPTIGDTTIRRAIELLHEK